MTCRVPWQPCFPQLTWKPRFLCFPRHSFSLASSLAWIGEFADGKVDYAPTSVFAVDCGCDGDDDGATPAPTLGSTPAPTTTAPIVPATAAPSQTGGDCATGTGVTVTSTEFPLLEGCLLEVDYIDPGGELDYTSGTGAILALPTVGEAEVRLLALFGFLPRHGCSSFVVYVVFAAPLGLVKHTPPLPRPILRPVTVSRGMYDYPSRRQWSRPIPPHFSHAASSRLLCYRMGSWEFAVQDL